MRGLYKREKAPMSLHARIHFINFARTLTVTSILFLIPLHFLKIGFNGMQIGVIISMFALAPLLISFPTGWINDRFSMAGVKVNTMANRGSNRSLPSASFLNVIVQNGKDSFDSLLKDVKEGLYVKGLRGSGTDATTGAFSVGCNGFWIENGAVAFPVDGVTLGGTTLEILKGIDKLANDLDMRSSINSPSFRVKEITVGGRKG
jgi:MFS family permease